MCRESVIRCPLSVVSCCQRGFALASAIFLLVILAALGAFMLTFSTTQHTAAALDIQGSRAYQASRAGIEWGVYQVLDPNDTAGAAMPACFVSPSTVALAGDLVGFTVSVDCSRTDHVEGNRNVAVYRLNATASSGAVGAADYVQRQLSVTVSKCKDPAAAPPKYSCG